MKQLRLWMLLLLVGLTTSLWAQEPIRILAVGNSFAQDAVEQNLHELAAAEGIPTIIANMYIGGCSLERHLNNARANRADYAYRKIGLDGVKRTRKGVSLAEALADEAGSVNCNETVAFLSAPVSFAGTLKEMS